MQLEMTTRMKSAGMMITVILSLILMPVAVGAHCDRVNGPVATAAREALENGNFEPIAIWVGPDQENELKSAFEQSLDVYRIGDKGARQLAERYFMETAVRLHRASEGFPYTGLKPEQPMPPDIKAAEKALDTGNVEPLNQLLTGELKKQTEEWFHKALKANRKKSSSVKAGREWVDAYVRYITYVHNLYQTIQAGPAHGVGDHEQHRD